MNLEDGGDKQMFIDTFLNSVYLYEDKMVIMLNYKDGEIATTFDEITKILTQKENPDNQTNYQSSPLKVFGDPPAVKSERNVSSISFMVMVFTPSLELNVRINLSSYR